MSNEFLPKSGRPQIDIYFTSMCHGEIKSTASKIECMNTFIDSKISMMQCREVDEAFTKSMFDGVTLALKFSADQQFLDPIIALKTDNWELLFKFKAGEMPKNFSPLVVGWWKESQGALKTFSTVKWRMISRDNNDWCLKACKYGYDKFIQQGVSLET